MPPKKGSVKQLDTWRDLRRFAPEIRKWYSNDGLTVKEIAIKLRVSTTPVMAIMRHLGIPRRKGGMKLERHWAYKGENASYKAMHQRLYTTYGKPVQCRVCKKEDPHLKYEYANLTGDYNNIKDYLAMCRNCHRRYDNARRFIAEIENLTRLV